ESGFSTVTVMDHLHQIPPVGPRTNYMLEGPTILAGLAARTSKVSLGLLVGGVTYRNPALLAKITTTLDIITGGRVFLGIGAAWFEEEHNAYGFDFPSLGTRFEHLEDALQIARKMFTEEEPSFTGTHHSISNVLNNPRPLRGDIPIMIGGSGEKKTLRMVAQYADACNVFTSNPDDFTRLMGVLDAHCERLGRDPKEITRTTMRRIVIGDTQEAAQAKLDAANVPDQVRSMYVVGTADQVAETIGALVDVGLEGLTLSMTDTHDLDAVRQVGETLAPVLNG
ncbi:MAG: hypothetical protein QOF76_3479, partial [Solirubrobacteraceae bacterium]|nr:hypothetical protein [Solirubrobacteraceae bacterium]